MQVRRGGGAVSWVQSWRKAEVAGEWELENEEERGGRGRGRGRGSCSGLADWRALMCMLSMQAELWGESWKGLMRGPNSCESGMTRRRDDKEQT